MAEVSQNAEQEIVELERTLAQKRAALEEQKSTGAIEEIPETKEILREALREKIAATPGAVIPPSGQIPLPPPPPPSTAKPPSYLTDELRPKVEELVKIAFSKSIDEAIRLAKSADNAALLDAFHDYIVDELYNQLVERGKLKVLT